MLGVRYIGSFFAEYIFPWVVFVLCYNNFKEAFPETGSCMKINREAFYMHTVMDEALQHFLMDFPN